MTYENLLQEAYDENIEVYEINFPGGIKGLYCDGFISINKKIKTSREKKCVLAEELGHYYTTIGRITDLKNVVNRKQERQAREWSFEMLVPLKSIIKASYAGCTNLFELSEYLDVTEEFLKDALQYYQNKYGLYKEVNNYCIHFNPLTVCKYSYKK